MPMEPNARAEAGALGLRPERLDHLENLLQDYIRRDLRQAIVLRVLKDGRVAFTGNYGANTKPFGVRQDTLFSVASITKPVISALLHILQEDGLVDLAEPVFRYLPEYNTGGRERICVWHLLTHTSGVKDEELWPGVEELFKTEYGIEKPGDGADDAAWDAYHTACQKSLGLPEQPEQGNRLQDAGYLAGLRVPLPHEPRSHMSYCNHGYQVLKYIIDAVTGEPIDAFAQRRLFHPLGMFNTHWQVPREKFDQILGRGERCTGYPFINNEEYYTSESGSGGLKTTAEDITRFMQMILNRGELDGVRALSRMSVRELGRNQNASINLPGDNSYHAWSLGFNYRGIKKDDAGILRSESALDHGGWAGTKILLDPEINLCFALFTAEYEKYPEGQGYFPISGYVSNVIYSALV